MATHYSHLSLEERERLFALHVSGKSVREIGRVLARHHTSLSRELHRNAPYGQEYIPIRAHRKAVGRGVKQRYHAPLKCPLIWLYVREQLRHRWSPETIAGRLPLEYPSYSIDDETIYRYIYKSTRQKERLYEYLPLHRRRRMRKYGRKVQSVGKIKDAIYIDKRPQVVNDRLSFGHWETDNMEGVRSDQIGVSVTVERVTRLSVLSRLLNKTAGEKTEALIKRLQSFPRFSRKTITTDNGAENSRHKQITEEIGVRIYFCHPYHSWEKGTVENTVGRLRRHYPKGQSLASLTMEELQIVENHMNNTPRKCLDYRTPYEKFKEYVKSFRVYCDSSGGALSVRM